MPGNNEIIKIMEPEICDRQSREITLTCRGSPENSGEEDSALSCIGKAREDYAF